MSARRLSHRGEGTLKKNCHEHPAELVIPKEQAVFWMDGQGRWHNQHGLFEHKRIIDHFNAAIQKDLHGYFVGQHRDGIYEKVYFAYQDTPLFVMDVRWGDPVQMILNTGEQMQLSPDSLFIRGDQLYHRKGDEIIKFSERVLMMISEKLECVQGAYSIRMGGLCHAVPEL